MLYKRNHGKELDMELFRAPTAEYRGAPFWAWNCKLDRDQILRQIDCFKEMGFGGFHMHSRTGMASPYLSEEFLGHVKACVEKVKSEQMLAWLYDEDRWASGAAGGFVTKDKTLRRKTLIFSTCAPGVTLPKMEAYAAGKPYFLAAYRVERDADGYLTAYERTAPGEGAWYAYVRVADDDPWFNNQAYPDTMDRGAVEKFIDLTYNAYERAVGAEFDQTVPAIFTDEPNFHPRRPENAVRAADNADCFLPWSLYFEERYLECYGEDILDRLPELFWITRDRRDAETRYKFWDFCAESFARHFADQCGAWCTSHGIAFTGHILREPTLEQQVCATGDNMRQYRSFTIPGIDMLCNGVELTTAKQCQSVVHQMGKEAMLSELYGVTNWDFDFRGHKFQGDWQAALGVTVRVPHLAWMSMEGEAKRDYPASIFYQSPWYKEYAYIEDHFARLNTALTRGTPVVRVGLIHPVESYWVLTGPNDQLGERRRVLDRNFQDVTRWLLEGHQDFNFVNESLLASLGAGRKVGRMEYDAIVVPDCVTLRTTTVRFLEQFRQAGGKVLFMSECPAFTDGKPGNGARALFERAEKIPFNPSALIAALEPCRRVEIRNAQGLPAAEYLYQLRQDGADQWLFVARFKKGGMPGHAAQRDQTDRARGEALEITLNGIWEPHLYDTLTGKVLPVTFRHAGGKTVVQRELFASDSLLLRFSAPHYADFTIREPERITVARIDFKQPVAYRREEPNVLLLDEAEWKLDDGAWQPREEILRLDTLARQQVNLPTRMEKMAQPWVLPDAPAEHFVSLRYEIRAAEKIKGALLAVERPETAEIRLAGKALRAETSGWYVDEAIKTLPLPELKKGVTTLELKLPLSARSNLEACYILGAFGVELQGAEPVLAPEKERLGFGSITAQGMPFYGGNITYTLPVEAPCACNMEVHIGKYRGALCRVTLDGRESKPLVFSPYNVSFQKVEPGRHTVEITVYGNRFNTFGCLHNCADQFNWYGPDCWRTRGDQWCYEYRVREAGVLISPQIRLYK